MTPMPTTAIPTTAMGPDASRVAAAERLLASWPAPDATQQLVRQRFVDRLRQHADALDRSCRPEHLTSSALVISADAAQVCLVLHGKAGLWLQSGGHIEPDDLDLPSAALREATEETGLSGLRIDPIPLQLSRHATPFCGGPDGHHLDVQFMAVADRATTPTVSEESERVAWFDVAGLPSPTDDSVVSLIAAARHRLGAPVRS